VEFDLSVQAEQTLSVLKDFMRDQVYPAEPIYAQQRVELIRAGRTHDVPGVLSELITQARERGLWNLFLGQESNLTQAEYAVLAEETGRSPFIAPAAMNCQSPDSGNMEMLSTFASPEQRLQWYEPLLDGRIRSGFSMTEPDVASSDATNISTTIVRDGDELVINGRKWFTTGAADPRCEVLFVLGRSDPQADRHHQHSVVIVPRDTPGVDVVRAVPVFGFSDQQGHCEVRYDDVRVPVSNLLGRQGDGFAVAQARLGPGRVHHCMRAIGMAERAHELMVRRAQTRTAFGKPLSEQGVVRHNIARSRLDIDQARLLVLHAAWRIDRVGVKGARTEISAIKVVAPQVAVDVIDKAIQLHGALGVTPDSPLAEMWSRARTLRIVDGPEDVHMRTVARRELERFAQ
jgi:acyl-CoA dehydrogenase